MKARSRLLPLLVISASFAAAATNQYWNVGGTGGDGIWGTGPGDKNWNLTAGAATGNTTWPDPTDHVAVFQDALGGTITVFDPVQTHGISQTGANYTIDAGVITLVADAAAAAPFLNVQTGTLTVNSVLAGTAGLAKTGPGTLVLSSANTFTGTTAIDAGTLNLTGSLASTDVRIANGGSLIDANGGLAPSTVLINAGTLTLGASDAVASYISNGGTLAAGVRALNVTSADLNDGSSVAGKLDGPTLTSNGTVSISGNTYCQTTNIASGTLTLTGTLGYAFLNIAPGATLEDQSGGLSSRINVTNAGTLAVNAAQSIESYIQSSTGSLTGTAVLTVNDNVTPGVGITLNGGTVAGNLRGNTTSAGDVLVSGTLGGGALDVTGGTLNLTGTATNTRINIAAAGKLIDAAGGLDAGATIHNSGVVTIEVADQVSVYRQFNGSLLTGQGVLTASSIELQGGTVAGNLRGTITTKGATGDVVVSGAIGGGELRVVGSTLILSGTSSNSPVNIGSEGILMDLNGGLDSAARVINGGVLNVGADETIATYTQDSTSLLVGGSLTGTGTLTTTEGAFLNDGTVAGNLRGNITSTGDVDVSGSIGGGNLDVTGGHLYLFGTSTNALINIAADGRLSVSNRGLDPTAVITNAGDLDVRGNRDTIASYISNAGTMGGGLTATTAVLNDGSWVGGFLEATSVTSNGAVLISGGLTVDAAAINSGTLTLTGNLFGPAVEVKTGATLLNVSGSLSDTVVLTNAGTLSFGTNDTISNYVSNGGRLNGGLGTLTASDSILNDGSSVSGMLTTDTLITHGAVIIQGSITANSTRIADGELTLDGPPLNGVWSPPTLVADPGSLKCPSVDIAAGASLLNKSGGLDQAAAVTNAGTLIMESSVLGIINDHITTYISNGGTLASSITFPSVFNTDLSTSMAALPQPGDEGNIQSPWFAIIGPSLTATTAALNDGSLVSGILIATTLTSNGAVSILGGAMADHLNIVSGTLTNTGTITASTRLNLTAGATLVASGSQQYNLLTTSGTGAGIWQGDLTNPTTVAPGGLGGIGILRVTGNFTNAPTGTLALDVGAGGSDLLETGGTATFGGTLALSQLGAPIPAFVPVTVVTAAGYAGNFTALTEDLDGAVWFNPANGSVTRLQPPTSGAAFGATANQGAVWTALYDDVIDPGYTNITLGADGLPIVTSGVASGANPDLLWALAASFTPTGLNAAVLDRLSPEVYTGLSDYAVQATRAHQRTALDAPTLAPVVRPQTADSKGGSKAATVANPGSVQWDLFGAIDHFNVTSDSSANLADYELDGTGFIAGVRGDLTDRLRLAGYAAGNTGTVTGPLLDADATGFSLGLLGELLLNERFGTRLTAGLSYGTYEFDGSRGSVVATAGGWQPGRAGFSNVESDAVELFIGVETVAWHNDRFRLIPAIGLRQAWSTMDSITENASAPGGPIALTVAEDSHAATLAEFSLLAEADLTTQLTLRGIAGFNAGLGEDPHALKATLSPGGRPFGVTADGLTGDAFFLGVGAEYLITESIRVGLNYRADFRSDADVQQAVGLSSTFRF